MPKFVYYFLLHWIHVLELSPHNYMMTYIVGVIEAMSHRHVFVSCNTWRTSTEHIFHHIHTKRCTDWFCTRWEHVRIVEVWHKWGTWKAARAPMHAGQVGPLGGMCNMWVYNQYIHLSDWRLTTRTKVIYYTLMWCVLLGHLVPLSTVHVINWLFHNSFWWLNLRFSKFTPF